MYDRGSAGYDLLLRDEPVAVIAAQILVAVATSGLVIKVYIRPPTRLLYALASSSRGDSSCLCIPEAHRVILAAAGVDVGESPGL